ncbi:MAG: S8 family serine peptidase [Chloroflexi bacterium]|nr:S8 family serine peptidase [Chloroflexota bacterium]
MAEVTEPGTTGRFLILMRPDASRAGLKALTETAGLRVTSTADFENGAMSAETLESAEAIFFDELAVAVVDAPPEQLQRVSALTAEESGILVVEPERVVYAFEDAWRASTAGGLSTLAPEPPSTVRPLGAERSEYLLGYREAINHLVESILGDGARPSGAALGVGPAQLVWDETQVTWGLQATNVASSQFTGRGIKVAVLDTGLDLGHPDFVGRAIVSQSFVDGEAVQDGHGHGTHVIGTACGPKQPSRLPRYGVAHQAEIFAGKVLSNRGSGTDSGILAGINWAIVNGCAIVSMSLGAPTVRGQSFSRIFETVAQRALARGVLIIAPAGNESSRPTFIAPVGHPANCPSIMAVGALNQQLQVAPFSCGGINPQGGQVDIAGPGVVVRSSWPRPLLYRTLQGTSMATPHVAGIAALHAEAHPDMRGAVLGWLLMGSSRRLEQSSRDVGVGLVQAP